MTVVSSTSDLKPAGPLGYAKGFAVTAGAFLTALSELISDDWPYKRYLQGLILLCAVVATIAIPNQVKPVVLAAGE